MDFCLLWNWLKDNSSQLQTIFALVGIILAGYALCFGRKQIKLSQAQRQFELKLQVLNSARENIKLINEQKVNLDKFKEKFFSSRSTSGPDMINPRTMETYGHQFDEIKKMLDEPENFAKDLISNLSIKEFEFPIQNLEKYLQSLSNQFITFENAQASIKERMEFYSKTSFPKE